MFEINKKKVLSYKKVFGQLLATVFTIGLFLPTSFAQSPVNTSSGDIRVEMPKRGIPAELVDEGDYYLHPDGRKLKFFRKKDVYALKSRSNGQKRSADPMGQLKATFGDRVEQLKGHRLGNMTVVRTRNAGSRGLSTNRPTTIIDAKALKIGNSVDEVLPVLANSRGNGDLIVSNKILVRLADDVAANDADDVIEQLSKRFGLSVVRKANVSGQIYSLQAKGGKDVGQRFALVRRVANSPLVEWAQPQFSAKPFKTQQSFDPNNETLYFRQWHLQNNGFRGSLCDADSDAEIAWGTAANVGPRAGAGMVIAIIDDGVQLNHPEFNIWSNPGETGGNRASNGIDDDGNGFIDDFQGWDFVDDSTTDLLDANDNSLVCAGANDGDAESDPNRPGQDNNPSGNDFADCIIAEGDAIAQDDHGTAVAGLAAARGNNSGTLGTAFLADILPIRLISDFDSDASDDFCMRAIEALEYAGRFADVINNSWGMEEGTCILQPTITSIVSGNITDDNGNNVSHRPGLGSPVIFAAGNSASGWVKVTAQVQTPGEHAYEWRFLRGAFPFFFESSGHNDTAYIDDIVFPPGTVSEGFEQGLPANFTTACAAADCTDDCDGVPVDFCPTWQVNTDPDFVRTGSRSAQISLVDPATSRDGFCAYSYLHTIQNSFAGDVSFHVWVDSDQQAGADKFEFLIDGEEVVSFGDLPNFVDNNVAFPANLNFVTTVGASDSGTLFQRGPQSAATVDMTQESRIFYSQFGPELDVLAPSSNQHLGITTTDRFGTDTPGFSEDINIGGNFQPDPEFTNTFGGTSAAAPIVAGVAAAIIATSPNLTALGVRTRLRNTADQIGNIPYVNGRNDFHGFGRVNMARALTNSSAPPAVSCNTMFFDYDPVLPALPGNAGNDLVLGGFTPVNNSALGLFSCPAEGPLADPFGEPFCFPVIAQNGNIAQACL